MKIFNNLEISGHIFNFAKSKVFLLILYLLEDAPKGHRVSVYKSGTDSLKKRTGRGRARPRFRNLDRYTL